MIDNQVFHVLDIYNLKKQSNYYHTNHHLTSDLDIVLLHHTKLILSLGIVLVHEFHLLKVDFVLVQE